MDKIFWEFFKRSGDINAFLAYSEYKTNKTNKTNIDKNFEDKLDL